jgi:DinB superfamily
MFSVTKQWNPKQKLLNSIIKKEDRLNEAKTIISELHSMVHWSEVYSSKESTLEDELWDGLNRKAFITMPTPKDTTIAWNLWHITRIEDLTVNILITDGAQVFSSDDWPARLGVNITDTGNAMNKDEIISFSISVNMEELKNYRIAVGRKTREVINNLKAADIKRKVQPDRLMRILHEGGVLDIDDSEWLLDFWGRKDVAGLILMPITRHQVVHLNNSIKLKRKIGSYS